MKTTEVIKQQLMDYQRGVLALRMKPIIEARALAAMLEGKISIRALVRNRTRLPQYAPMKAMQLVAASLVRIRTRLPQYAPMAGWFGEAGGLSKVQPKPHHGTPQKKEH